MNSQTICGISLDAFKTAPSAEEMAAVIAKWNSSEQAEFLSHLAEKFKSACGYRDVFQFQAIVDDLNKIEEDLCDGGGSRLIRELACRLGMAAAQ